MEYQLRKINKSQSDNCHGRHHDNDNHHSRHVNDNDNHHNNHYYNENNGAGASLARRNAEVAPNSGSSPSVASVCHHGHCCNHHLFCHHQWSSVSHQYHQLTGLFLVVIN